MGVSGLPGHAIQAHWHIRTVLQGATAGAAVTPWKSRASHTRLCHVRQGLLQGGTWTQGGVLTQARATWVWLPTLTAAQGNVRPTGAGRPQLQLLRVRLRGGPHAHDAIGARQGEQGGH